MRSASSSSYATEAIVRQGGEGKAVPAALVGDGVVPNGLERHRSVEFFTEPGFTFDTRFTDETATAMIVNEHAVVMLLTKAKFKEFTKKELADPRTHTEAILAVSAESREDVDAFADKALAVGGSPANEPSDLEFMYGRSFQDPDGHLWEIFWMDPSALERAPAEVSARQP